MAEIQKPTTINEVWADAGDKIKPEPSKVAEGWLPEIPTRQNFNWLDNRQDMFNAHVNQRGIPEHDLLTEYQAGKSYIQGKSGQVYQATSTNKGQDPDLDVGQLYWSPAFITVDGYAGGKRFVGFEVFSNSFTAVYGHRYYATAPLTVTIGTGNLGDAFVVAKNPNVIVTVIDSDSNSYTLDSSDETTFIYTSEGLVMLQGGVGGSSFISLNGPITVTQGSTNSYTITDYNSFSSYSVSTSVGTFTRSNDVISLVVPNPANTNQITLTVTRDGVSENFLVAVGAQSVATPTILYPSEGQLQVETSPTLQASQFSTVPQGQDTHQSSQWQVATDSGFTTIVYNSGTTTVNKTSISIPANTLLVNTTYYARVRYTGAIIGVSSWSPVRTFTTTNRSVVTPTVTVTDGPTTVGEAPTVTSTPFTVTTGTDTHVSTDWQVVRVSDSAIVWQSLGNTTNKTSIKVPAGILQVSTGYTARVRYSGANAGLSGWGEYSFTTKSQFFDFTPSSAGLPYGGGYYAGLINVGGATYALVVSPKTQGGESLLAQKTTATSTPGTSSTVDGLGNTSAMISAGAGLHPAASFCDNLSINGFTDWYLPAKDEMEIVFRYLKPTAIANATNSGLNMSAIPATTNYTATDPSITSATLFRQGGAESLTGTSDKFNYWTSTEVFSAGQWQAYTKYFVGSASFPGYDLIINKPIPYPVRAIRRVLVSS